MDFLLLIILVFFTPLFLFIGWMALSSCLGSRLRNHLRPETDAYGRSYLRTMANSGPAMSEQIELESMLADSDRD